MCDHHDRVALSVHNLAKEREHATPGLGVQRSGRLVGEYHLGPVTSARVIATRCC